MRRACIQVSRFVTPCRACGENADLAWRCCSLFVYYVVRSYVLRTTSVSLNLYTVR